MTTVRRTSPVYGATNPAPEQQNASPTKRFASVVGLEPEKEQYYRELHANAWPGVLERLQKSNVRNFSIFIADIAGKKYLFSYFEYSGDDFAADQKAIATDPETQRWWQETDPCQVQVADDTISGKWSPLELVFNME